MAGDAVPATALQLPQGYPVPDAWAEGRNPREGYQRSAELQFGRMAQEIEADPLYRDALKLALGRTLVAPNHRMNLYLIIRFFLGRLPSRNIIEFGAYKGGNAIFMAACLRVLYPEAKVYALDTYGGMPETADVDLHSQGDFNDVDLDELRAYSAKIGLTNIEFVKGRFEATAEELSRRAGPFGLSHVDCDIYSAVKYSADLSLKALCPGGYLAFDDATTSTCLGATQAVEELIAERGMRSEQIWPHFVFRAPLHSSEHPAHG